MHSTFWYELLLNWLLAKFELVSVAEQGGLGFKHQRQVFSQRGPMELVEGSEKNISHLAPIDSTHVFKMDLRYAKRSIFVCANLKQEWLWRTILFTTVK